MITSSSKVAHKAVLGLFSNTYKFFYVWDHNSLLVASVRHRWSRSSAPSVSYRSPRRPRSCGQRHFHSGSLSHARSSSSPRRRRCFGKLARSRLGTSGRATPPSAPPASPRPRCRVGCGCRASVSPHCPLRHELTSPELRRGHRYRGQGSIVHHFSSLLSQKLR